MNNKLLALLSFGITFLVLTLFHHEVIFSPNSFLLGDMIDGLKNYYTPLFHIYYDNSLSSFEGMNYPYGEQIVFADAQPLLSNFIKLFSGIWDIKPYTIGILNFLMFSSIPLASVFLFLSLKRLEVSSILSVFGAVSIALLAPQLVRIGGHFALSYAFVIPLYVWLYLKFRTQEKYQNHLIIGLSIWVLSGLHMYFFALGIFFFGLVRFVELVQNHFMGLKNFAIKVGLEVFLPFLLLQTWFLVTDGVADRPNNPYGFLEYCSHWQSVFFPLGKDYATIYKSIFTISPHSWEGIAYVGIPTGIFCGVFVISQFISSFRIQLSPKLTAVLISSVLLLLFAFGIPFIWKLEWLVEYSGPLKQFRGVGRFAWIFYFIASIAFISWVDKFIQGKHHLIKFGFLFLVAAIYSFEIYAHQNQVFYQKNSSSFLLDSTLNSEKKTEFEAIIPIPFFHTGSENIWVNDDGSSILKYAFTESLKRGLPIVGVQMSRTSLSQTIETLKLVYNGKNEPTFIDDSKMYLLVFEENYAPKGLLEKLIVNATFIETKEDYKVYSISGKRINQEAKNYEEASIGKVIISESFDDLQSERVYSGKGALEGKMNQYTKILELENKDSLEKYCLEFKYFMNKDVNPTVSIIEELINPNGVVTNYKSTPVFRHIKSAGNWSTIKYEFNIPKDYKVLINLQKYTAKRRLIWVDDMLVYSNSFSNTNYIREQIDLSDFSSGLYYLNVKTESGLAKYKLILN